MPALLTRISTRPKALMVALTISSVFFGSVLDRCDRFLCGAGVGAGTGQAGANVADHHARALFRHQLGNGAPDAAPAPGDDGGLA
jgi:hypothetical protein